MASSYKQQMRRLCSVFCVILASLVAFPINASLEAEQARLQELRAALSEAEKLASSLDSEFSAAQEKVASEKSEAGEAQLNQDAAQAKRDELAEKFAKNPSTSLERSLKDAEYQLMLAERKLSSAKRGLERAERKLANFQAEKTTLQNNILSAAQAVEEQENLLEQMQSKEWQEAQVQAAAAKAKAEEEAKQKAAEEAARLAKEEEAQLLKEQFDIDENCQPIPNEPTHTTGQLTTLDKQLQAFAKGVLRQVNRLIAEAPANDIPPLADNPVLEGSKLNPCDPAQKQMLVFSYLGNSQYRLETRVLAGEQEFWVTDLVPPIRRVVQPEDNGELYTFFLDLKYQGRYKLVGYKKSLFEAP